MIKFRLKVKELKITAINISILITYMEFISLEKKTIIGRYCNIDDKEFDLIGSFNSKFPS